MFTLNTDWVRYLGAHSIHAGIDGALQFLKSTAHRTDTIPAKCSPLDNLISRRTQPYVTSTSS